MSDGILQTGAGVPHAPMSVAELEAALFDAYPRAWAEPWDHIGLASGDPAMSVTRVALALDATAENVRRAAQAEAQVLLTHHPVYLKVPKAFSPASPQTPAAAACIWESISQGVALIAMHTNLDRSAEATAALPRRLGLDPRCGIEFGRKSGDGALGSVADLSQGLALDVLARRCRDAFGRVAQVFGDAAAYVRRCAFFTGSLGDCGEAALTVGADVVVCGECGYHRALDLLERGCAVIILGHDASEAPLVDILTECARTLGFASDSLVRVDGEPLWHSLGD